MERTPSTETSVEPHDGKDLGLWITAESRNFHISKWPGLCCDVKDKPYRVTPLRFGGCFLHQLSHPDWYSALSGSVQNASGTTGPPGEPLDSLLGEGLDSNSELIKEAVGSLPGYEKCGAGEFRSASTYIKLNTVKGILWCPLRWIERTSGKNSCSKLWVRVAFFHPPGIHISMAQGRHYSFRDS